MSDVYVVDAVRTPVGKRGGGLSHIHPADLGAHVLRAVIERTDIDPGSVDDVVFGCVDAIGPQAGDIARTSWLAAGLPDHVPGVTVDRQCGSSQQAVQFASHALWADAQDVVIAGGVQSMSQIPISAAMRAGREFGHEDPFSGSTGWIQRYGEQPVSQFFAADLIAEDWGITRGEMESFALESHERAIRAIDEGRFKSEIAPIAGIEQDEGPRRDTTLEKMATLPTLRDGGRITAAVSSQVSDGAAALLLASERALERHDLVPRARITHTSARGSDAIYMLTGPIPATAHALKQANLSLGDIDVFEVNEAFASVVLAWYRETGADPSRVNVNGGAIALGHPLGATGARLMTSLISELERSGGHRGLQTMCEGGGQANVTIVERVRH